MPRKYVRKAAPMTVGEHGPEKVFVRPRPGFILAGIPATGTDVPKALADEWKRMGLVVEDK